MEGRTPRTTSQRVAPSAVAPSCISRETVKNRSRLIEAMIGTTMIVRMRLALNSPVPVVCGAPKIGRKPSALCRNGSRFLCRNGASTTIPQNPRMTLGMAASISTSGPITPLTRPGATVLRYRPIEIPIGTAKTSAPSEVTAVPYSSGVAPKMLKLGFHSLWVRKPHTELRDGRARAVDQLVGNRRDHGYPQQ